MDKLVKIYDFIIDNEIATDEEISLCRCLCGWNEEMLNGIIYARTEYHDREQCLACEPENFYDRYAEDEDYEDGE